MGGSSRSERLILGARVPARGNTSAEILGPVQSKSFGLADGCEKSARGLGGDNCGRRPSPENRRAEGSRLVYPAGRVRDIRIGLQGEGIGNGPAFLPVLRPGHPRARILGECQGSAPGQCPYGRLTVNSRERARARSNL